MRSGGEKKEKKIDEKRSGEQMREERENETENEKEKEREEREREREEETRRYLYLLPQIECSFGRKAIRDMWERMSDLCKVHLNDTRADREFGLSFLSSIWNISDRTAGMRVTNRKSI
jgi:hypothetical protein